MLSCNSLSHNEDDREAASCFSVCCSILWETKPHYEAADRCFHLDLSRISNSASFSNGLSEEVKKRMLDYLWSRWQALKLWTRVMYPTRSAAPSFTEDPAMVSTREKDGGIICLPRARKERGWNRLLSKAPAPVTRCSVIGSYQGVNTSHMS